MSLESSGVPTADIKKRRETNEGAPLDPAEALERMLLSAHRLAVTLGDLGVFQQTEISVAEWTTLKALNGRKDVPIGHITASTGVSRQRLHKVISELEQKGLVVTAKSKPGDKRVRTVSSTPTAAQVLSLISRQMRGLLHEGKGKQQPGRSLGLAARSMEKMARTIRRSWHAKGARRKKSDDQAVSAPG